MFVLGEPPETSAAANKPQGAACCTGSRERMERWSCPEKAGGRGKRGRQQEEMAAWGDETPCRSFGEFLLYKQGILTLGVLFRAGPR